MYSGSIWSGEAEPTLSDATDRCANNCAADGVRAPTAVIIRWYASRFPASTRHRPRKASQGPATGHVAGPWTLSPRAHAKASKPRRGTGSLGASSVARVHAVRARRSICAASGTFASSARQARSTLTRHHIARAV